MEETNCDDLLGSLLAAGDLNVAEAFARSVEGEWQKSEALNKVARALASVGSLDDARQIWRVAIAVARAGEDSVSLQDSLDCSSVLWEIAEDMALCGERESAGEVAAAIKNEWKRERALGRIADIVNGGEGSFRSLR